MTTAGDLWTLACGLAIGFVLIGLGHAIRHLIKARPTLHFKQRRFCQECDHEKIIHVERHGCMRRDEATRICGCLDQESLAYRRDYKGRRE